MKVLFLPEVRLYFQQLQDTLFEKEYFGFEESAVQYVRDLILDIEKNLPAKMSKTLPASFFLCRGLSPLHAYFNRYGKNLRYATFRKNKHTQWYAFFNTYQDAGEIVYVIRYISNNHVISQYL